MKTKELSFNFLPAYLDASPDFLRKYILYLVTIEGKSDQTALYYFRDIIQFFRYLVDRKGLKVEFPEGTHLNETTEDYLKVLQGITPAIDVNVIRTVTTEDVQDFLFYLKNNLKNVESSRNRRLSSIKEFYEYCRKTLKITDTNPAADIPNAKCERKLPVYLTLEECNAIYENISPGDNYERDYCVITFFLNCGLRLSELVNIDIPDIKDDTIRIMGKEAKERMLYLNNACQKALKNYLNVRFSDVYKVKDSAKNALFVSAKGNRLSKRRVEQLLEEIVARAGLQNKGFSPHKLRHTCATLMYQEGVDVLTLKDFLGHENVNTTQIYTHTNSNQLKEAANKNPLANK